MYCMPWLLKTVETDKKKFWVLLNISSPVLQFLIIIFKKKRRITCDDYFIAVKDLVGSVKKKSAKSHLENFYIWIRKNFLLDRIQSPELYN